MTAWPAASSMTRWCCAAGDRSPGRGRGGPARDEVAHRAAGDEQPGVLAEEVRGAFLEGDDGRVVAEDVVADLGRGHRPAHRVGRVARRCRCAGRSGGRAWAASIGGTLTEAVASPLGLYSPASPQLDPWCSGPTCQPVTLEIAGSNPVGSAITRFSLRPVRPPGRGVPSVRRRRSRRAAAMPPSGRSAGETPPARWSWRPARRRRRGAVSGGRARVRRASGSVAVAPAAVAVAAASAAAAIDAGRGDARRRRRPTRRPHHRRPPPAASRRGRRGRAGHPVPLAGHRDRPRRRSPTSSPARASATRRSSSSSDEADAILAALGAERPTDADAPRPRRTPRR